jgi:preprotein translocase subunit SecG
LDKDATSSNYADFCTIFLSQTAILFIVFIILLMYFKWISFYRTKEFKEKRVEKHMINPIAVLFNGY